MEKFNYFPVYLSDFDHSSQLQAAVERDENDGERDR